MNRLIAIYFALIVSFCYIWLFRVSTAPRVLHGNDNFGRFVFVRYSPLAAPGQEVPDGWQSRRLALDLTGWFVTVTKADNQTIMWVFAIYNTFWLSLTLLLVAIVFKEILPVIGTGLCLWLNAIPELWPYVLPWDMPCMFFFTLAFVGYRLKEWPLVFIAAVIGGLFKDSVLVSLLFFIAAPWAIWRRLVLILIGLVVAHIEIWQVSHASSFAVQNILGGLHHINRQSLWHCGQELLANGGTLVLLPFCIIRGKDFALGVVCLSFAVLLTLTNFASGTNGIFNEYRAWQDILPLSWCLVADLLKKRA